MWCLFVTHFLASVRNDQVETERRLTGPSGEVKAEASKGGDGGVERGQGLVKGEGNRGKGLRQRHVKPKKKKKKIPKDGNQSRIQVHADHAVRMYEFVIRRRRRYCAQSHLGHGNCL